ncbi:hypothetical protein [Sulfurimonas sp. HSL3-2]|uniref:hypothetical protein n=1 Tax=Hydrocurvibacter mobilis TaxID=3131936 RepID=UPI0031F83019
MFKTLIYLILALVITGCGLKKMEDRPPLWYTNPPKDTTFIYSTASSKTMQSARNIAVLSINRDLNTKVMELFKSSNSPLEIKNELEYKNLMQTSMKVVNSIVFHGIKTINSAQFHSQQLILISVSREMIFQEEKKKLDAIYEPLKKELETIDTLTPIEQYAVLKPVTSKLDEIAVLAALLQTVSTGYDANEYFAFVNNTKEMIEKIDDSTALRVLGDFNSLRLVRYIEGGLSNESLLVNKTLEKKNSYNIFIMTTVDEKMDYQFYKTTLGVKTIVATKEKKIISEKMHTFIGKSRKSNNDARLQAESSVEKTIRSFGIFDFLGLNKK